MERVTCYYCGLPFKVRKVEASRDYFCCTGCAMLSRVPIDEKGQFPVNAYLVGALATAFVFFNQLLFWLVAVLLVREARMEVAVRLFWASGGAALVVWLSLAFCLWKAKSVRLWDFVIMTLAICGHAFAFRRLPPVPLEMALTNVVLIVWLFRGVFRSRHGAS
ncbi:MAG: hypothetical protein QM790_04490 [Nibricoccus sp.]